MSSRNKLLPNYGWVQNTSNLSTIRDTVDLVPETGIKHSDLMHSIKAFRESNHDLPSRWSWDARCRIKAIHATGMVKLNRYIQGYDLTELGKKLKSTKKSESFSNGHRILSNEEKELFKDGLLTNPPVIRVLSLLNNDRKAKNIGKSKYDIGSELGFVGDFGFTHIDPYWVASNGYSFNDKEGDADKWARTILSWLSQVGWVYTNSNVEIYGKKLILYKVNQDIETVLRYKVMSIIRNVPYEMLCSDHHPFPIIIQNRRSIILENLAKEPVTVANILHILNEKGIQCTEKTIDFEIINLTNVGFVIEKDGGYYKLIDKIDLDLPLTKVTGSMKEDKATQLIEELVVKHEKTIPAKYIDHLIRFSSNKKYCNEFESIVAEYFRFLGYDTKYYGQGKGRVADVLVKYIHPTIYAKSYGIIIDAKASNTAYNFPVADKRKMKEYITKHGPELMQENISKHAFSFVSASFIGTATTHLNEIAAETSINGCAIDVITLITIGHQIKENQTNISELYPNYSSNKLFKI